MNTLFSKRQLTLAVSLSAALLLGANNAKAQEPVTSDDSTVTYPAEYFAQFQPYSVNDMLARIPGINLAQGGGRSQGGPGAGGGRGLGAGGDQVLINGRRIAGKSNEGNSQLSRIAATEVQYIEIIRGTSGDLDVRGGTQVINVVLNESQSNVSFAYEVNLDQAYDGELIPGGKISATGQSGAFNYFLSAEREPRYDFRVGFEEAFDINGALAETVNRETTTDGWPISLVANLGYEFSPRDTANLNLSWTGNDLDDDTDRAITRYETGAVSSRIFERDLQPTEDNFYEIGGDYMHVFENGSRWKTLFIVNDKENLSVRSRYKVDGSNGDQTRDLFLSNFVNNKERIVRSSYIFDMFETQSVEAGVERAQTILDTSLQLGLLTGGNGGDRFGGLTPFTDSIGTVEEMRYEYFAIHNWAMNDRMTLETTLLFEDSSISQTGTLANSRDFNFFRPKVDYRFDITPAIQFRGIIEKDVAQLSFRDFTAGVDGSDDEQDAFEGNADLRQTQSWRYEANFEFRLPNDAGVINTNFFYHDLEDLIDNVDVSTANSILSARGNIGDGERYGFNLNSSLRLNFINQPNMLVSAGLNMEESTVTDPFLQRDRERSIRGGASRYNLSFRHDLPQFNNTNYGIRASREFYNDFTVWDIDKIEQYPKDWFWFTWVETQAWGGLVYRFEVRDSGERCRIRTRYSNGTIANGTIDEVEDSCSVNGPVYAIKIRGTF
jgi:outer membrane receptor for ferrienterochelin and colicins